MKNKMPGFSLLPDQGRKYKVAGLDANIGFDAIDQLFPFFFVFDQSLKICLVGSSLKKLESSLAVGSLISERFVIVNPRVSMNFEQLLTHYIAQHNWLLDNSVTLRGQLLPILNDRFLIFLGSPWIQDTEQLSRLGLTFGDFAKHDSTLENLFIKQAQLTYAIDNQALRATMEQSIAELKKLEALHEELAFELNTTYDLKVRFLRRNIILDIHVPAYLSKKLNRLELIGKDIYQALPFLNTPLTDALQDNQEYSRPIPLTFEIEVKDRKYVFEARLIMTPNQEYLLLASDVTQEHYLQAQLEKRANYDSLTGLANRSYFFEQIERLKSVHSDRMRAVTAMIIDLDNFKLINDRYGHAAGDFVLKTVAKVLVEQTRDNDIATRLGGDEFGIYACNSASTQQMIEMAKRICTCIDQPIYFEGHSFRPSCSIGLAFSDKRGVSFDELQAQADLAMYHAKAKGKGGVVIYQPGMYEDYSERQSLLEALSDAIISDQISIAYQPVVVNITREIVGFEALARWVHKTEGNIPPDRFIKIAENNGLMIKLGRSLMRKTFATWAALCKSIPEANNWTISLNISTCQLHDPSLIYDLNDILSENKLSPKNVILEITETALIEDLDSAVQLIQELKKVGYTIALDDFGTGYSSLSYLDQLPIDIIKIDRSFIDKISNEDVQTPMVEAIIQLARILGLEIVAEGIETEGQRKALERMGCEFSQGFLFSKPVDGDDLIALIKLKQLCGGTE